MHCKSSPWCELPSLLNLDSLAAISSDVAAISRISSELLGRAAADSVRDGLVRFFPCQSAIFNTVGQYESS